MPKATPRMVRPGCISINQLIPSSQRRDFDIFRLLPAGNIGLHRDLYHFLYPKTQTMDFSYDLPSPDDHTIGVLQISFICRRAGPRMEQGYLFGNFNPGRHLVLYISENCHPGGCITHREVSSENSGFPELLQLFSTGSSGSDREKRRTHASNGALSIHMEA